VTGSERYRLAHRVLWGINKLAKALEDEGDREGAGKLRDAALEIAQHAVKSAP
jgi:hypothetical protein